MDELVGEPASKAGIGAAMAAKSVGIIPGFLRNEGPPDTVRARIDKIPATEAAIATSGTARLKHLFDIERHDISDFRD